MRFIELRAWYKDEMWYDVGVFENGVYAWSDNDLGPEIIHDKEDEEKFGLPIVTQFTGLLDRNTVKIWEGDIVKFVAGKTVLGRTFKIVWKGCGFVGEDFAGNHLLIDYNHVDEFSNCEVLGNIFENLNKFNKEEK